MTSSYQIISIEISNGLYQKMLNNGKTVDNLLIYQLHQGEAKQLAKTNEDNGKKAAVDCYWVKPVEGVDYLVIRTKNFSTYAIGYQDEAVVEENVPQERNPSGGGGGGSASYSITIPDAENGKVSLNRKNASAGQTVTITATPDEGYALDQLTVLDKNGKELEVTDLGDGRFSFKMPNGKVSVNATFKPAEGESDEPVETVCPRDETCPIEPFTDTENDFWWHDGIHYCVENGLMQGVGDDLFDPNGTLTRAQIVTILWRMEEKPVVNYAMSFEDVPEGEWYSEPIRWAQSTGVVLGYSDEAFGPNDPVTREQLAAILMRYAAYRGIDVSERADLAAFTDVGEISAWALENVKWANAVGLIKGRSDTTIVPTGTATRAEAATMVQRFCENVLAK